MNRGLPVVVVGLVCGCASFQPRPIDPAQTDAAFHARSLAEPGLRAYMAASRGAPDERGRTAALDLEDLTLVAFYYHPELDVARSRLALAEAAVVTAGARPNPTVSVTPQYAFDSPAQFSPWVVAVAIDMTIETAGKRRYRIARAERLTEAWRLELAESAWQVRRRVRDALAEHLFARQEVTVLEAAERARSELVAILERRLALGDIARPFVDVARGELGTARLAVRSAEGRVAETRAALAGSLGIPASALTDVSLDWPGLGSLPPDGVLAPGLERSALLNRPDIQRALAEYTASEAKLQLEIAHQYPDIRLGPAYEFDQGENRFGLGLAVTLPVFSQNQGPIAEAEAARQESGARFLALQASVIGELEQARTRYRAGLAELSEASATEASLDALERATERGVALGDDDRGTLVLVRVTRLGAARARIGVLRKARAALSGLEDAVRQRLDPTGPLPPIPARPRAVVRTE